MGAARALPSQVMNRPSACQVPARRRRAPTLVRGAIAVLAAVVVIATGCSSGSGGGGSAGPREAPAPPPADPALVGTYGYGALADPEVTYQPDVVVVGGGPGAIRSARADGLEWVVDGSAPGARDLAIGSVMFATATAVGRVVGLAERGGDLTVTLAPVELGEVVRDGAIALDQPVDLSVARYQLVPELPGALAEPGPMDPAGPVNGGIDAPADPVAAGVGGPGAGPDGTGGDGTDGTVGEGAIGTGGTAGLRPVRFEVVPAAASLAQQGAGPGGLAPSTTTSVEVPVGDWVVKPAATPSKLSLEVKRKATSPLKVSATVALPLDGLRVEAATSISDGIVGSPTFLIHGIKGLEVSISAGAASGALDNSKVRMEVPVDINLPIPPSPATGGLPVNVKVSFKFLVTTALSGNNSTLLAHGRYGLDGPLGVRAGEVVAPTFSVEESIIDSISGIAIGPSGIVVATSTKLQVGIGTPAATAGPYGSLTSSIGLTNGSALGSPLATCRSATLDLKLAGGASLAISSTAAKALERLLPTGTKAEYGVEVSQTILSRSQTVPDVPLCRP